MDFKFDKRFEKLAEACKAQFTLRGSTLLVEIPPPEEIKTAGGIVMVTDKQQARGGIEEHRIASGKVILVGEGYYDAVTNTYLPLDIKVGDIVLLPKFGISYISVFPGLNELTQMRLGFVKEPDVLFNYKGEAGLKACKDILNG